MDKPTKVKIILIILFFVFGLLVFFTMNYANSSLQWLNIIWIIIALVCLGISAFACPNCFRWFTLKEIERIELARFKGSGTLKLGTLQHFDWISPKATEEDKNMLTLLVSSQDEMFGIENRRSEGAGILWGRIYRIIMRCSNCKYKIPRYKKTSQARSKQTN